jgi:hypothetical protein
MGRQFTVDADLFVHTFSFGRALFNLKINGCMRLMLARAAYNPYQNPVSIVCVAVGSLCHLYVAFLQQLTRASGLTAKVLASHATGVAESIGARHQTRTMKPVVSAGATVNQATSDSPRFRRSERLS